MFDLYRVSKLSISYVLLDAVANPEGGCYDQCKRGFFVGRKLNRGISKYVFYSFLIHEGV